MNSLDKKRIKGAVIQFLESYGKPLTLPLPIKAIAKSFGNIRLISYSTHMKRRKLSYNEVIQFIGSTDACTDYDVNSGKYIIYYNDIDESIISSNRYRWNIAHELGHIFLNHHKNYEKSRIFRNSLSKSDYKCLENEADMFAAYILVPHIIISCVGVAKKQELIDYCRISSNASDFRFNDYVVWKKRNRSESYDFSILNFYSEYIAKSTTSNRISTWLNKHGQCALCLGKAAFPHRFCPICGSKSRHHFYLRADFMKFNSVATDEKSRAIECPNCHNTALLESGDYCMICGRNLINFCADTNIEEEGCASIKPSCDTKRVLPGYARYCPYCGNETAYLQNGFLAPWDEPIAAASVNNRFDDSDLPF